MGMAPPEDLSGPDDGGPEARGRARVPGDDDRQAGQGGDDQEPESADDLVEEPDWCRPGPEEPEDWDRATLEGPLNDEGQGDWWEADEETADSPPPAAPPEDLGEDDAGLDLGPSLDLDGP